MYASKELQQKIALHDIDPEFERRYHVLLEHCLRNLKSLDDDIIRRAFLLGHWAHRNDKRKNGEPYFYHPIEVALIVAKDLKLDDISVAAALLHDVVEDTEIGLDIIRHDFGDEIANIVDGLTKIDQKFESRQVGRAENARKLLLKMVDDLRIILIKFADRLHNMRTLDAMSPSKRLKIAGDTNDFFIPLAHRFGLYSIKGELEDLVLKATDRQIFDKVAKELAQTKKQREAYIKRFIEPISAILKGAGYEFSIKGRPKSIHSIANKMRKQNKELHEIYDLFAIRIVLEDVSPDKIGKEIDPEVINGYDKLTAEEQKSAIQKEKEKEAIKQTKANIWSVFGLVTDHFKPIPDRIRDHISVAKTNRYQSLHTTVFGPDGRKVEVQIRSKSMDEIAEQGVAAHYKYKEGTDKKEDADNWFSTVRQQLEDAHAHTNDSHTFVQNFKLDLFEKEIQVFTPKGEVYNLPPNATPIDFAFAVHTQLGLMCAGAKINGRIVPLSTILKNADQVEIIRGSKKMVTTKWNKMVVTNKAKSAIRKWFDEKKRGTVEEGQNIWEKAAKKAKIEADEQILHRITSKLKIQNKQELFFQMGSGTLTVEEVIRAYRSLNVQDKDEKFRKEINIVKKTPIIDAQNGTPILTIQGDVIGNRMEVNFAVCCNPIPGDQIFAFISNTRGLSVHKSSCKNAQDLNLTHPDQVLDAEWTYSGSQKFAVEIGLRGQDRLGLAAEVTNLVYSSDINIKRITIGATDGAFEGNIALEISDTNQLDWLINRLKTVEGLIDIYRMI